MEISDFLEQQALELETPQLDWTLFQVIMSANGVTFDSEERFLSNEEKQNAEEYTKKWLVDGLEGSELNEIIKRTDQKDFRYVRSTSLSFGRLDKCDFRNANLQNCKLQLTRLEGALLQDANLQGAELHNTNLQKANLQKANLQKANLLNTNLQKANLQNADLQKANLQKVNLQGARLEGANFTNAQYNSLTQWPEGFDFKNSGAIGPNADLQYADLQEADLQNADLQGANLQGANLQYANLQYANLQGADLQEADLQKANLREADLMGARLEGANFTNAQYDSSTQWPEGFDFINSGAIGPNADLQYANLQKANLQNANLQYANLQYANLQNANLLEADLQKANLREADLMGARLEGANFTNAQYDSSTQWPEGFDFINSGAIGPNADLQYAALQNANLQNANLQYANLRRANLQNANLLEADLQGAGLQGADLREANLRRADLREADLLYANLLYTRYDSLTKWPKGFDPDKFGAIFSGVVALSKATIYSTEQEEKRAMPKPPEKTSSALLQQLNKTIEALDLKLSLIEVEKKIDRLAEESKTKFPEEELDGVLEAHELWLKKKQQKGPDAWGKVATENEEAKRADLTNANLTLTTKLHKKNLQQANLYRIKLDGAFLRETSFFQAEMAHARLTKANLTEADLRQADLREADLTGADLRNAKLQGADLQNANLSEVIGLQAKQLAGCNISGTVLPDEVKDFKGLERIDQISSNVRNVSVVLLVGCVFSWVTMTFTSHYQLISNNSTSTLPLIGGKVEILGYYIAAPIILMLMSWYLYTQLQLLWEEVSEAPSILVDGKTIAQRNYPWLLEGIINQHVPKLSPHKPQLHMLQFLFSNGLVYWIVPLTIGFFWYSTLVLHSRYATVAYTLGTFIILLATYTAQQLTTQTLKNTTYDTNIPPIRPIHSNFSSWRGIIILVATSTVWFQSWNAEKGNIRNANLSGLTMSKRSKDWSTHSNFLDVTPKSSLANKNLRGANIKDSFFIRGDLKGSLLEKANLSHSDFRGANFEKTRLAHNNLTQTKLHNANFNKATLHFITFRSENWLHTEQRTKSAWLQRYRKPCRMGYRSRCKTYSPGKITSLPPTFKDARMKGVTFPKNSNFYAPNFKSAWMNQVCFQGMRFYNGEQKINFNSSTMLDVSFKEAKFHGKAHFRYINRPQREGKVQKGCIKSTIRRLDFRRSKFYQLADFGSSCLKNANFGDTTIRNVNFSSSILDGAYLLPKKPHKIRYANFEGASLKGTFIEEELLEQFDTQEEKKSLQNGSCIEEENAKKCYLWHSSSKKCVCSGLLEASQKNCCKTDDKNLSQDTPTSRPQNCPVEFNGPVVVVEKLQNGTCPTQVLAKLRVKIAKASTTP